MSVPGLEFHHCRGKAKRSFGLSISRGHEVQMPGQQGRQTMSLEIMNVTLGVRTQVKVVVIYAQCTQLYMLSFLSYSFTNLSNMWRTLSKSVTCSKRLFLDECRFLSTSRFLVILMFCWIINKSFCFQNMKLLLPNSDDKYTFQSLQRQAASRFHKL